MIIKLRDGFHTSEQEPIMLILNDEEKKSIGSLPQGQSMIAMYPTNGGYTKELISAWMYDGIQFEQQPAPVAEAVAAPKENTDGPDKV